MRISPQMDEFRQQLQNSYDSTKIKIPKDTPDEDLLLSNDYRRCVLIYNVLATMFGSDEGYEWGEIAAEMDDYDIEKFLKHYSVEIIKGPSGYKFDFKFNNDSTEEGQ